MTGPPAQVTEPGPLRQAGRGIGQAAGAGLAGAMTGATAGALVSAAPPVTGFLLNAGAAVFACLAAAAGFGAVVWMLDGGDLRALAARPRARFARNLA